MRTVFLVALLCAVALYGASVSAKMQVESALNAHGLDLNFKDDDCEGPPKEDEWDPDMSLCGPDSRLPVPIPKGRLPFCKQYQKLSCCDAKDARAIQKTTMTMLGPACPVCHAMLSEMRCSECHPNASAFWYSDPVELKLCEDFCLALFDKCKDIPFEAGTPHWTYLNADWQSAEQFCATRTAPEPGCFRPSTPIPDGEDRVCKCPEHDCHEYQIIQVDSDVSNLGVEKEFV